MSAKLTQTQESDIGLSEQALEAVVDGAAGVGIDVGALAQGSEFAFTNTQAFTGAFSNGIASVGAGAGAGAGVAVSVNQPSLPSF